MLIRICKCGRKILQGQECPCQKDRHKIYDLEKRNKDKQKFYSSTEWRKVAACVKARAKGLDEYRLLVEGVIEVGTTVHHIYTIEERPDLRTSFDNLIYVSARTHKKIHDEYKRGEKEKKEMQEKLFALRRGAVEKVFLSPDRDRAPLIYTKKCQK